MASENKHSFMICIRFFLFMFCALLFESGCSCPCSRSMHSGSHKENHSGVVVNSVFDAFVMVENGMPLDEYKEKFSVTKYFIYMRPLGVENIVFPDGVLEVGFDKEGSVSSVTIER